MEFNIPRGITAIVGGGGKTSLQNRLGKQLAVQGRVILTTSTHIYPPACFTLIDPGIEVIESALAEHGLIAVGKLAPDGKLTGIPELFFELPRLADYVIVEADGAKRLPLKAPAAHEPVIPQGTQLVIAVAGMDGIGQPICKAAHRPELYASIIGKSVEDTVTAEDVSRVLCHERGQRKGVDCRFMVVLNKADTRERLAYARRAASLIPYETYITSLINEEPIIEHMEARV